MDLVEAMRTQADACARLGSPMYEGLLGRIADDVAAGGIAAHVLEGHQNDPGPSALALRLVGSLHWLVLAGEAGELAAYFPTAGGSWDLNRAWPACQALMRNPQGIIRRLLAQAPQTNEVGRATALMGGLLQLSHQCRFPVRLFEIGSSGGLNLRADAFRYTDDRGHSWGPEDSPVNLEGAWRGPNSPCSTRSRSSSGSARTWRP